MVWRRGFPVLAVFVAACLVAGWWARADEKEAPRNELVGKFVSIIKKSDPEYITSLEKVSIRRLGDDFFLAGIGADDGDPDNWQKGVTIWIAVNDISEMMVFPSLEELRKTLSDTADERTAAVEERPATGESLEFADLDYQAFDQQPGCGWRKLAESGNPIEAAHAIDEYLRTRGDLTDWQRASLRFHAGQMYAMANQNEAALARFRSAIDPEESADSLIRWNAYVRATIAFLERDRERLMELRQAIAGGPEFDGEIPNLAVVDRLIERFEEPYSVAYARMTRRE